jgi:hypothetical protein
MQNKHRNGKVGLKGGGGRGDLRIKAECVAQAEGKGVVLAVLAKLLAKLDKSAVKPSQYVTEVLGVSLAHGPPGHDGCRSLLVK